MLRFQARKVTGNGATLYTVVQKTGGYIALYIRFNIALVIICQNE